MVKLVANYETGEGKVINTPAFQKLDPILQADFLQDWIYDLEILYGQAIDAAFPKTVRSTARQSGAVTRQPRSIVPSR
jgi:hypothetical protein